jgi:Na(+)-translocating NADH-quinone reductase subunit B
MKQSFLLSNRFKPLGWTVFAIGFLLCVLCMCLQNTDILQTKVFTLFYNVGILGTGFCGIVENNVLDEIAAIMTIVGGVFIMFSKEKNEDEFIASLRLNALSWAVLTNCAILLFAIVFVYDFPFFWVLVGNMFTIPIIFILRFYWLLHCVSKNNGEYD